MQRATSIAVSVCTACAASAVIEAEGRGFLTIAGALSEDAMSPKLQVVHYFITSFAYVLLPASGQAAAGCAWTRFMFCVRTFRARRSGGRARRGRRRAGQRGASPRRRAPSWTGRAMASTTRCRRSCAPRWPTGTPRWVSQTGLQDFRRMLTSLIVSGNVNVSVCKL